MSKLVVVRRHWNDWRQATVRLESLAGFHWTSESGGVRRPSPFPFLHAYMSCDAVVEGELAHSCAHGAGPHRIKVCVLRMDNEELFPTLREQSDGRALEDTYNGESLCPRCGRETQEGDPAVWPADLEVDDSIAEKVIEELCAQGENDVCQACLVDTYHEVAREVAEA